MHGQIDTLNCMMGDLKLSFNARDPRERERARNHVKQAMRSGTVFFVHLDDGDHKVKDFDETLNAWIIDETRPDQLELIISDVPEIKEANHGQHSSVSTSAEPTTATLEPTAQEPAAAAAVPPSNPDVGPPEKRKGGRRQRVVPATDVEATAVPPRAGG